MLQPFYSDDADAIAACTPHQVSHHLLQWDVRFERHTVAAMPKKGSALHLTAGLRWLS